MIHTLRAQSEHHSLNHRYKSKTSPFSPALSVRTSTCSAAAFTGFGDDDAGFYQTYSKAFQEVWERERDWGEAGATPGTESWGNGDPPEIGRSTDGYETAEAFYTRWSGFVSGLSFGWVDEYNVNEVSIAFRLLIFIRQLILQSRIAFIYFFVVRSIFGIAHGCSPTEPCSTGSDLQTTGIGDAVELP